MNVNEAMTATVKTCRANTSLEEIARLMWDGDCGAIPVVDGDDIPIGIVTDRDVAMAAMLNHQPLWELQAQTVIQGQKLCSCSQQEPLEQCLNKMEQSGVRRLLVTDDSGKLAGILSLGDAVAFTQPPGNNKQRKARGVAADETFGMLRKVSAHHKSAEPPIVRINEQQRGDHGGVPLQ